MSSNILNKIIIAITVIIVILTIILLSKSCSMESDTAQIELIGSEKIVLHQYDNYIEYGYKIVNKKNNDYNVKIDGKVNTSVIGNYNITYNLYNNKDKLLSSVTRKVFVFEDDLSTTSISLKGEATEYYFVGDYKDSGFTAYRNNQDISNTVVTNSNVDSSKQGRYTVEYYIQGTNSKKSVTREVYIIDLDVNKTILKSEHIIKLSINVSGYDHVVLPNEGTNKNSNITYKYATGNLRNEYVFDIYLKTGSHKKYVIDKSELGVDSLSGTCTLSYGNKTTTITMQMNDISKVSKFKVSGEEFTGTTKVVNGYKSKVTVGAYNEAGQVTTITCTGTPPTPMPKPTSTPKPTITPEPYTPTVVTHISFVQGYDNKQTVCKTFLASGFNKNAVAGLMANIERESNFNLNSLSDSGTSNGLFQWHSGRLERLQNYCGSQYLTSIKCQLEYFFYEITQGTEKNDGAYEYLMGNHSAYDMGFQFCMLYERPGGMEKSAEGRGYLAENVYLPYVNNGCN